MIVVMVGGCSMTMRGPALAGFIMQGNSGCRAKLLCDGAKARG